MKTGFNLCVIFTIATAFLFACMYTGAPLCFSLKAATILHFYSLTMGAGKANWYSAGHF